MAALLSNQVDIADLGGTETMSAYVGGADVVATALFVPVSPWALYVPASYKDPSDLKGKTLGIVTKGGSSEVALLACLKQINIDPSKDVTIQAIGGVPALASAMIAGAVYAGPGHPPDTTVLTKAGFKVAVDLAKQKVPATDNTMVTTRTYASANKAVVQRYVNAADEYLQRLPAAGFDANGQPLQCRATTRRGTPCQRVPLHHNGYCPSHQHLAETEELELGVAA